MPPRSSKATWALMWARVLRGVCGRDGVCWDRRSLSAPAVISALGIAPNVGCNEDFSAVCTARGLGRLDTLTHLFTCMCQTSLALIKPYVVWLIKTKKDEFNSESARATKGSDEEKWWFAVFLNQMFWSLIFLDFLPLSQCKFKIDIYTCASLYVCMYMCTYNSMSSFSSSAEGNERLNWQSHSVQSNYTNRTKFYSLTLW